MFLFLLMESKVDQGLASKKVKEKSIGSALTLKKEKKKKKKGQPQDKISTFFPTRSSLSLLTKSHVLDIG